MSARFTTGRKILFSSVCLLALTGLSSLGALPTSAAPSRALGDWIDRLPQATQTQAGPAVLPAAAKTSTTALGAKAVPGSLLWEDRYDASGFEQTFMAAARGGRVFAAGFVATGTGRDFVVRAYDGASGEVLWQNQLDKGSDEFASGVAVDDRRVYVSGTAFTPGHGYDWILRAYRQTSGELLWETTFDLAGSSDFSRGTALMVIDGLAVLGGYGTTALGDQDWVLRAHRGATGEVVWQDRRDLSGSDDGVYAVDADETGLYAGGWAYGDGVDYAVVRAYEPATGELRWEHRTPGRPGFGLTYTRSIAVSQGQVAVGQPIVVDDAPTLEPRVQLLEAATGQTRWSSAFTTGGAGDWLSQVDLVGGQVVAVGSGGPDCPGNCDAIVRSHATGSGALRWQRHFDLSGADDGAELVTLHRGAVYVHSQADQTTFLPGCCVVGRWVVQALDGANGALLWQSYGADRESGVYNMVVDRNRLFVPGRAVEASGDWDWIVRAYDARGRTSDAEVVFAAPAEVQGDGVSGQLSYAVTFPDTLSTATHGAVPATEQTATVVDDPANDFSTALGSGVGYTTHTVSVSAGARHLRVSLFDEHTDGVDDLDLYVFGPGGGFVAASASFTSAEKVDIPSPTPGDYTVYVHGYETDGPEASYTLFSWSFGPALGNLAVSGPDPSTGPSGTVTVTWNGLTPGLRYLGAVAYSDSTGVIGSTMVSLGP